MQGLCFPGLCDLDWARTLSGPGLEHCGGSLGPFGVPAFQALALAAFCSRGSCLAGRPDSSTHCSATFSECLPLLRLSFLICRMERWSPLSQPLARPLAEGRGERRGLRAGYMG